MAILSFLIVLGVLVLVHEYGHFLMARRAGIRVEAFSIGFGPRLFGFRSGETDFKVCLLPLGGFVKMVGEDPEDNRAADPDAFTAKSVPARAGVVIAGPVMNILLACCIMPLVFLIGRQEPVFLTQPPVIERVRHQSPAEAAGLTPGDRIVMVDGARVGTWEEVLDTLLLWSGKEVRVVAEHAGQPREYAVAIPSDALRVGMLGVEPPLFYGNEPVLDRVMPGGAAAQAGLQAGDRVLAVEETPIDDWQGMADAIHARKGASVTMRVQRQGAEQRVQVTPEFNTELGRYVIGVQKDPDRTSIPTVRRRYDFVGAVVRGEREVLRLSVLTGKFLQRLVTHPTAHYRSLGGPIQIAQASVSAAKTGFTHLLYFSAFLSLQLGMLNLLPIPVLDGGHLVFLAVETLRRRPLSARARLAAQQVGMVLLLSVLLIVTVNDLDHLLGIKRWFGKWF